MTHRPNAAELLNIARETLKTLVNDLPQNKRYDALMILNAMAIAAREVSGADDAGLVMENLKEFYEIDENDNVSLVDLDRRLAKDIRAGKFDSHSGIYDFLVKNVTRELQVSNPKYITGLK